MYSCRGICQRNKVKRPVAGISRYLLGQKLCINCETYMLHTGPHCPCCGGRLRSNPKSGRLRRTLQEQKSMIT